MSIVINPGSDIGPVDAAWTNTYEGAVVEARRWHERMRSAGFGDDIQLIFPNEPTEVDGRWTFMFQHKVTGVIVELCTHGISDINAYTAKRIFWPRVYWNGSSTSNPELSDWAAPGFVQTFRPGGGAA